MPFHVRSTLLALAAAGLLSAREAPAGAQDSPSPTDPSGASPADSLTAPSLPVRWRAGISRGATAAPLVSEERVYVATARHDVKALRAGDGGELWSRQLAQGFQASPALAEGVLIVSAPHPEARAFGLNPRTGDTLWERRVGDLVQPPLLSAGRAIFISLNGRVSALELGSGAEAWETRLEGVFPGGALLLGDDLVILAAGGTIYRLDARSGRRLGSLDLRGSASPAMAPAGEAAGFLLAYHTGRVRGFHPDLTLLPIDFETAPLVHPPVFGRTRLIAGGTDRVLRAFAVPSGERQWQRALPAPLAAAPVLSHDESRVAVGDLAGDVWTLDAADGRVLTRTHAGSGSAVPRWQGDGLLAITERGEMLALGAGGGAQ
ncbi:MAG: PQQ-binding-like beta-propeller repeat protein [Gemmatimonadetes bacterium]|nr:PQQ-binding-like beta-propeller repeat protein [Gemmatimonadota bacterium]